MADLKLKEFPSILPNIKIDSKTIKEQIDSYSIVLLGGYRDNDVEKNERLPLFITIFYSLIIELQKLPTQEEFWNSYYEHNKNHKEIELVCKQGKKKALQSRAYKTYPSLVRDLYVCVKLKEEFSGSEVIYNINLDAKGIDVLAIYKEVFFGLRIYLGTKISLDWLNVKWNERHKYHKFGNVKYIDVITKKTDDRNDKIWLPSQEDIDVIQVRIKEEYNNMIQRKQEKVLLDSYGFPV